MILTELKIITKQCYDVKIKVIIFSWRHDRVLSCFDGGDESEDENGGGGSGGDDGSGGGGDVGDDDDVYCKRGWFSDRRSLFPDEWCKSESFHCQINC